MTMIWMRTGSSNKILADLFGVSATTASRVFTTWVNLLYQVLIPLLRWSPRDVIDSNMPQSFRDFNPNTRIIIDCTELFLQRPKGPSNQAVTYSTYKSRNTVKVLVGISPDGAFTYLSPPFGGNVWGRYIVRESGFLDNIKPGDDVMTDHGFTLWDLLLEKDAKPSMPSPGSASLARSAAWWCRPGKSLSCASTWNMPSGTGRDSRSYLGQCRLCVCPVWSRWWWWRPSCVTSGLN